jgi:hypothetical protein
MKSTDAACACRSIDINRASSRADWNADVGVSRHSDRHGNGGEAGADFHGRHLNFTTGMVQGFDVLARVTTVDDVVITFNRSNSPLIDGTIDRVTGFLQATYVVLSENKVTIAQNYMLKCTPAQRKF